MSLYEISFYSEAQRAIETIFCADMDDARRKIQRRLRERQKGIYTATLWGKNTSTFLCFYINDQDEVFSSVDPLILSKEKAARLRLEHLVDDDGLL